MGMYDFYADEDYIKTHAEVSKSHLKFKKNPLGIWVRSDGKFFKDRNQTEPITLEKTDDGYLMYRDPNTGKGPYAHRIMVFTFGDCDGREYQSKGHRCIVDHKNMKHWDNDISNLQLVSNGINLFRAYYKAGYPETEERFKEYYFNLDEIDRKILDAEIAADIRGEY